MLLAGMKVKIPDIGPLATVIKTGKEKVKLELDGHKFWISRRLVRAIN